MKEKDEKDDEKQQPLFSRINSKSLCEVGDDRGVIFEEFEHFGQSQHAHDFVEFAYLGEACQDICLVVSCRQHNVKW